MATAPAPFPTFPSVAPPPPFCFGAPPYAPYPFPYPNQPPPPSPSYHAAAYHNHHSLQLPPPYHPNPHWHQGMQQMQPPPPAPGNPWHPHHAAAQPPPPSSPPPRRPPPSSPPPLAASMAAVALAWPFPSASVPAVQEGAAPSTSSSGRLPDSPGTTSAQAAALIVLCSGPGPERRPSSPSSAPVLAPSATQARRPKPPTIPSREVQAREEAITSKDMPRAVLDLQRRLDEQQARDRTSFNSLQGELAKLTSMAAQLTVSIGKLSSSAHASNLEQSRQSPVLQNTSSPACTDTIPKPSATPSSSPWGATNTNYVAPQLFGEMPKPNSGHGTLVMAPGYEDCCYGYPNQIQSSCVQGGSSNPCEHYLDGQPHHYGFDNLKRQSVFRADGTEHSYYALPTDYPLERATPAPRLAAGVVEMDVCSAELVDIFVCTPEQQTFERKLVYEDNACLNSVDDVFAPTTEQQPYEEEKRESGQALKCFSKTTFSGEKPTVCTVGIFSLKDDARACNYSVLKASNSVATRSIQLITEHCKRELKLLWDPGALLPLMSSTTQHYSPALQPASDATAQGRRDAAAVYKVLILQLPMSTNSLVWDPGIDTPSSIYFWLQDLSARIATRKPLPWLQISELATWRSQVASASYVWDPD